MINTEETKKKGMIDIWEQNIYDADSAAHWRWFPAGYTKHLKLLLYRFNLYGSVYTLVREKKVITDRKVFADLRSYIGYMDKVLTAMWEETRVGGNSDDLGPDWRCITLEDWLRREHAIRRHSIKDIEKHVEHFVDPMNDDPLELDM
jgi:hypothetical protein